MGSKEDIQNLLRFLTSDAKLPLALALGKVRSLLDAALPTPEAIAKESITKLHPIFADEKSAKAVLAAAKRVSKKRSNPASGAPASPSKRSRPTEAAMRPTRQSIEASLELPTSEATEAELAHTVLHANRAPLVLAFALKLLEHTRPQQPLSSRLSLAQALVSANSRSKAVSLGLESGSSAEEQGWGQGQPMVKIMGREIHTLKRYGYEPTDHPDDEGESTQDTLRGDEDAARVEASSGEIALWGLDLEAVRTKHPHTGQSAELPVYRPESARAYILKAFASPPQEGSAPAAKKKTAKALAEEKEANCGHLLRALELLFKSWAPTLGRDELDRRAWTWYVRVRPDVASGVEGWGGRNEIRLQDILDLRREDGAEGAEGAGADASG